MVVTFVCISSLCMYVCMLIKCLEKDGADKKAQDYKEEAEHLWPDVFAKIEQKVA